MKSLILTLLLTGLPAALALAQHKVTVDQKGQGNSVSINQGNTDENFSSDTNCVKAQRETRGSENTIIVKKGDSQSDTVLSIQGQPNSASAIWENIYELIAHQNGSGNGLYITIPDNGDSPNHFASHQTGRNNTISAATRPAPAHITASQRGTGNKIAINPCNSTYTETEENNSVNVTQEGDGNTVQITQNNR